jgi:hypothetical protein
MGDKIGIEELQAGDILLYRGTSFVSKGIQFFDGSPISHASVYLGNGEIGEAVAHGLVVRDYRTSFHGNEWVKAYRLAAVPDDLEPVLKVAQAYLEQGNRYGYEQLFILALLCTTRRLKVTPILRRLLRTLLEAAATALTELLNAGKQPMICSEFAYRVYDEAEPSIKDVYSIVIPGMLPLPQDREIGEAAPPAEQRGAHPQSLAALFAAPASRVWIGAPSEADWAPRDLGEPTEKAELDALIAAYLQEAESGQLVEEERGLEEVGLGELQAATDRFVINLYRATRPVEEARATRETLDEAAERSVAYQYLFQAAPDFVTPADLYTTESLVLLGTMETE